MKKNMWILLILCSTIALGQNIQDFQLINAVDDKPVALKSFSNKPVVIIFYTIHCPYSEYYLDRIKTLAEMYNGKVQLLMINSSTEGNESIAAMKGFAGQCNLSFPYLADKDQQVMVQLNPHKSPECLLLQPSAGKFSVVYRGAIDDNAQSVEDVNHPYLVEAIEKLLAGKKIEPLENRPVGCTLKR
jgi:peroxiredoxin